MKRILFFFISVVCIFTISACASSAADTTEYEGRWVKIEQINEEWVEDFETTFEIKGNMIELHFKETDFKPMEFVVKEYEQTGVIRLCRPGYPEEPGYLGYYDYIEVYDEMLEGAMFVDDIGYVFDKFKRIEEE